MSIDHGENRVSNDLQRSVPMRDKTTTNFADEEAVRDLYRQLMDGWNRGSGTAFASAFTEDGDLVAFDGTHFKGQKQIAPFHQQLFEKWLRGRASLGR